jgi:hypothetical protein
MNPHLDFGAVFDRTIDIYKSHLKILVMAAVAVFAFVFVITLVALLAIGSGNASLAIFVSLVMFVLAIIASYVYTGMVIRVVQHQDDRREHSLGELYRSVAPVLAALIGTSILAGIFVLLGFIALIVPGLILMTHFALVAAIVVVERLSGMNAIKRSWALVKGNAWTVFAVIIVLALALAVARAVLGAIGFGVGEEVGRALMEFVANIFLAPLPAIAGAVMYFMLAGAPASAPGAAAAPSGGVAPPAMPGTAPSVSGSTPPPPPPGR